MTRQNAVRWQQVKKLLQQAMQLESDERVRFLDNACRDDLQLRAEVMSLLVHHEEAEGEGFLDQVSARHPASSLPAALDAELSQSQPTVGPGAHLSVPDQEPMPTTIGRYEVTNFLGRGAFGSVYLAYDDQLQREVAIKVPRRQWINGPGTMDSYIAEARLLAALDHENIVPVYDFGKSDDGCCYVVSKFIEGSDLREQISIENRFSPIESAQLVATLADALHYAHKRRIIHRDIKPANILVDVAGKPYVADFGLALKDEDYGREPALAGTIAYMSPEQTQGEGHLVDGRSDIFSLAVVLYELLTGVRPFDAPSAHETVERIKKVEARPPRQLDDTIPRELERICLKALSKRATDRYTTAKDFGDDLRQCVTELTALGASAEGALTIHRTMVRDSTVNIIPKGLRSFDEHDADFFLQLLPGPRDRTGIPESIRFWKTRIEQTDPDRTFRVGLLYGPSGCGKSSLIRAGLLPRLALHLIPVYIEASASDTETRLLNGLRKAIPSLPADADLPETIGTLRRGRAMPQGKKVLIVLDQFEQWLNANRDEDSSHLVQALRQCDGGNVQCLLTVRDDFWMAMTRFLRQLEVRLVEDHNVAAAELLPERHAQKMLAAFGRAFGALPQEPHQMTKQQNAFIEQSVTGILEDGKVVCVRLSLFAELMKGKEWTPDVLKEVGGAQGIGVTFLEETFSSPSASPEHRYHQRAARAVLAALLPESATGIKGQLKSRDELLAASGYVDRPNEFEDLIKILDSEVRLITPTDPAGADEVCDAQFTPGQSCYQLTHDYLVPSLSEWLTRKQKETRHGRAELCLEECASTWSRKPESRFLPGPADTLNILLFSRRALWTTSQRKMMRRASIYYGTRALVLLLLVLGLSIAIIRGNRSRAAEQLARQQALSGLRQAREAVDTWLTGPFEDLQHLPGTQDFLVQILEKAAEDYERFAETAGDDVDIRLERGRILLRQGHVFTKLEQPVDAQKAYDEAQGLFAALLKSYPERHDILTELANAKVALGQLKQYTGQPKDASAWYESALAMLNDSSETTQSARHHYIRGMAMFQLSQLNVTPQAASQKFLRDAIGEFETACSSEPEEYEYVRGLSSAWQLLAHLLQQQGDIDQAQSLLEQAIENANQLLRSADTGTLAYELRADANQYLASLCRDKFERRQELGAYRAAFQDYELLVTARPGLNRYRRLRAVAQMNLGLLYYRLGHAPTAKQHLLSAKLPLEDLLQHNLQIPRYRELLAVCLDGLGQTYLALHESVEAQQVLQQSVDHYEILAASHGADPIYRERQAIACSHLAQANWQLGEHSSAQALFELAAQMLEDLIDVAPAQLRHRDDLATLYVDWGEILAGEDQKTAYRYATENWDSLRSEKWVPDYVQHCAWFLLTCPDQAFRDPARATELAQDLADAAPSNPDCHALCGAAAYRSGQWQASLESFRRMEELGGELDGRGLFFLAMSQQRNGEHDQAKQSFRKGVAWLETRQPGSLVLHRLHEEAKSTLGSP